MISISSLHLPAFLIYLLSFITISYAKTLGSPTDQGFQEIFQNCMNNDTLIDIYGGSTGFGFGRCPNLIDCVLSSASEGTKAGMSSGTSIASLIPTMLALIGTFVLFPLQSQDKSQDNKPRSHTSH